MSDCIIRLPDNLMAEIEGPRGAILAVGDALSYRPKGYVFSPAYKNGYWDGYIRLLKGGRHFPGGLTKYVHDSLRTLDRTVEIQDERQPPEAVANLFPKRPQIELTPYQETAVSAACGAGRGIVHHPVGAGKTIVMLEVIRRLNVRALALVHRKDLLYQIGERAREIFDIKTGLVGDGRWEDGAPFTVATFQTLYRRLGGYDSDETREWLKQFAAVHVDEVQHVDSTTYEVIMQELPNAYYRFGYSATPFRSGDKGTQLRVMSWTGPVIDRLPNTEGIRAGRLVPAHIFVISPTPGKRPIDIDYPTAYETGIAHHDERNGLIVKIAKATRKLGPTLILVERLEHGKSLATALQVPFLSGSSSGFERMKAWEALRVGAVNCLVASVIADEGLDIPGIEYLILGGGGKAAHRQIQRIGRGMRSMGKKKNLTVFDFADGGLYLGRHSRARQKVYKREATYTVVEIAPEEILEWLTN